MAVKIVVDAEKCTGCMSCVLRCSLKKSGAFLYRNACLKIVRREAQADYRPYTCSNCTTRKCLQACDYEAINFDSGLQIPVVDQDLCIGCGRCVEECEFGIIRFHESKDYVYKCDLCWGKPACVEVCVPEAIRVEK